MAETEYKDSSAHFFGVLVGLGLCSILLILVLAGFGLKRTYDQQIFSEAKKDAVQIAEAILYYEGHLFFEDGKRIHVDDADMASLDRRLRRILSLFEISKIKIFDEDARVVYSTDTSIIGLLNKDNPRLARALAGQVDSSLKRKDSMVDLAEEEGFDLDVVESYVPLVTAQGQVVGSIELYKDVTRYRQIIRTLVWKNLSLLGAVLLLVFLPVMLIVNILTRRLSAIQHRLSKQASIDALTGVLSRREILARAKKAGLDPPQSEKRHGEEHLNGIMMLDIDHFKRINDVHGHLVGDLILKNFAKRLSTGLRRQDLVGRFGGEEFLVIFPNSSLATTYDLAERIRKSIAAAPFSCEGRRLVVTVSIGVSCYVLGDEAHFLRALEDADKGLYLAKKTGRNQVCLGPQAQLQSASQ